MALLEKFVFNFINYYYCYYTTAIPLKFSLLNCCEESLYNVLVVQESTNQNNLPILKEGYKITKGWEGCWGDNNSAELMKT